MLHRPVVGPVILLISGEPARMIGFRAVVAGASTFNVVVRPPKPTATLHRKSLGIVPVTWENGTQHMGRTRKPSVTADACERRNMTYRAPGRDTPERLGRKVLGVRSGQGG